MNNENKPIVVEKPVDEPKKETFITFKQILLIVIVLFILVFMLLNFNQVQVNLLFAKIEAPLVVVIFLSYILGSVVTWLMHALNRDRSSK